MDTAPKKGKMLVGLLWAVSIVLLTISMTKTRAQEFNVLINTLSHQAIDAGDGTSDISLSFGADVSRQLVYDVDVDLFAFTQSLYVGGNIAATGGLTAANESLIVLNNGTAIFNQKGEAVNFRIESDNEENMFFISGPSDRVGIGTSNPATTLDVNGSLRVSDLIVPGAIMYSDSTQLQSIVGTAGSVLISGGSNTPSWKEPIVSYTWYIDGALATGIDQGPVLSLPHDIIVSDIDIHVKTAPATQSIVIDLKENGVSIFSQNPEVSIGQTSDNGNHTVSDTTLAKGSHISLDIDQVGFSPAGSSMTVMLHGYARY